MIRFRCNKISRDKTLQRMADAQVITHYRHLQGPELAQALRAKLLEETHEVLTSTDRTELVAELADVLEVITAICDQQGISQAELLGVQAETKALRGGFSQGVFMEYIEMADDSPWVAHFRKQPDKYPEF